MIKSLIRRGTLIGMVSTAILSTSLSSLKALALPAEEIVQKLNPVPVFTIADEQGAPLVATQEDGKVAGVFISQEDANNFVTRLETENPDLASKVQVVPVPLGEVYKLSQENAENESLNFAYVPNEAAVNDAKTVSGSEYTGGVPLFVATGGEDGGYLTIQQETEQVIPFFFEKQQLENMVENFKTQEPDLAASVNIQVVPLESIIQTLQDNDDPMLSKIVLVPSSESIQFLQQSAPQQPAPGAAPEPAPAPQQ